MPGMDGYETAALIRSRKRTASTPIVFLTAIFRDEAHVFQAYSAGAVDVVFKPVDPFILKSKVHGPGRPPPEDRGDEAPVGLPAVAARRARPGEGREGADRAGAARAPRRGRRRSCSPCRSSSTRAASSRPSRRSSSPTPSRPSPASRPAASSTSPDFGSSRIHPDDLDRVVQTVSGAGAHRRTIPCEFRWLCADGQYQVLQDQGVVAPSDDGEAREIFGVILDATDRRRWRNSSPRRARWRRWASSPAASPTTSTTC